jgi:hypothetical protein
VGDVIEKQELAEGIRFAGRRAAAAANNCKDWDHQLGHQWTTADAFRHIAAVAGGVPQVYPMLDGGVLNGFSVEAAAINNANAIKSLDGKTNEEVAEAIVAGHEASAAFVETLEDGDLATVVQLGGYEMPKAEVLAQIWIHHPIAHAYEASARWPL